MKVEAVLSSSCPFIINPHSAGELKQSRLPKNNNNCFSSLLLSFLQSQRSVSTFLNEGPLCFLFQVEVMKVLLECWLSFSQAVPGL